MRTIKFRGKRIDKDEWVYGYYYMFPLNNNPINDHHYIRDYEWVDIVGGYADKSYQVIPETIGQFTGLHDKNGKEIYEGDIVDSWAHLPATYIREVVWGKNCGMCFEPITGYTLCEANQHMFLVIGNIHDKTEQI